MADEPAVHAEVDPEDVGAGADELERCYRLAMARLPGGVAVVAGTSGARDVVAVVTSLVSLSLEPPTVLVAVHEASRLAETLEVGRRWAATVMGAGSAPLVTWLAEPGRPDLGQLQGVPHHRGEVSGAAVLEAGAAWVECVTTRVLEAGDHAVVLGRVERAGVGAADGALVHRLGRVRDLL
ncbi:flavin reductase family protein [Litorihabitans aurantiacus]|uniref:Oxidoreductase n=1 Tax=Litorihabitans aurantiacus TaxID=1930061 RepID=A0AA37UK82_9MICO|nr:flavin reductase family protein [Litorihabitans aurantiacus]GMA30580.1 oxidoreductase [Litorihabitans aurantiacus]